jgi:hypothetical protein
MVEPGPAEVGEPGVGASPGRRHVRTEADDVDHAPAAATDHVEVLWIG